MVSPEIDCKYKYAIFFIEYLIYNLFQQRYEETLYVFVNFRVIILYNWKIFISRTIFQKYINYLSKHFLWDDFRSLILFINIMSIP